MTIPLSLHQLKLIINKNNNKQLIGGDLSRSGSQANIPPDSKGSSYSDELYIYNNNTQEFTLSEIIKYYKHILDEIEIIKSQPYYRDVDQELKSYIEKYKNEINRVCNDHRILNREEHETFTILLNKYSSFYIFYQILIVIANSYYEWFKEY